MTPAPDPDTSPAGGSPFDDAAALIDTSTLVLYVLIADAGNTLDCVMGGTSDDWQWIAQTLRTLAFEAEAKSLTEQNPEADRG